MIHVFVALCDNEHQGIVPVPAFLGNGEDTAKKLYWGAGYGVKTFFSKLNGWLKNETAEQVRGRAAAAYSRYQKIILKSAQNLLVTGW